VKLKEVAKKIEDPDIDEWQEVTVKGEKRD
jgi:hypothetical protein